MKELFNNYDTFINYLKLKQKDNYSTKDILKEIYYYYKDNVSYDYDFIQNESLSEYILKEILKDSIMNHKVYSKEEIIDKLNDKSMEMYNMTLTKLNKKLIEDYYVEKKFTNFIRYEFKPIYKNNMLVKGVCKDFQNFEKEIFNDLGIKYITVVGYGSTNHIWNMVYLEEENRWCHFDMTMAKYCLDKFNNNTNDPEDWICPSTFDIFKMQENREIHFLNDEYVFIDKNNCNEINEYLEKNIKNKK